MLRVSLRVAAAALVLAAAGAIALGGADVLRGRQLFAVRTAPSAAAPAATRAAQPSASVPQQHDSAPDADSVAQISAPLATAISPGEPPVRAPIVGEGRTELGDGLFAVRDGASVTVHFDVPQARTRRRDKFDRVVRATLPRVYGPAAQAVLDEIPQGQIVQAGTIPAELEKSGLRIPLGDSAAIELWPELRDAQGGPLVVGYRVAVAR